MAITSKDLEVLSYYASSGNRLGYWNYLANISGADGYGRLALGVVRNDTMPGSTANNFAQDYADSRGVVFGARRWEEFGQDLIKEDFARRQSYFDKGDLAKALNLPAADVESEHVTSFTRFGLDGKAWTPEELFVAARSQGGEAAVERVWSVMLDDGNYWGVGRLFSTATSGLEYQRSLAGAVYFARLGKAWTESLASDNGVQPDVIRGAIYKDGKWYDPNYQEGSGLTLITSADRLKLLNEERAVRVERISHPKSPLDDTTVLKPKFLISDGSGVEDGDLSLVRMLIPAQS